MEQVFSGSHWKTLLIYLDDVIVICPDLRLLSVVCGTNLTIFKLKPSKCNLLQPEVKYLGHVVSRDDFATDPEKVQSVESGLSRDLSELRAFLGLVEYYRQYYISGLAGVAQPLNWPTAKRVQWQ